jgi:hypothetical protein
LADRAGDGLSSGDGNGIGPLHGVVPNGAVRRRLQRPPVLGLTIVLFADDAAAAPVHELEHVGVTWGNGLSGVEHPGLGVVTI